MMFRSIRSRLALSFAGIALVAALALGAVLLAILHNYYLNQELNYLRGNAQSISEVVAAMLSVDVPSDEVQLQIKNLAFLAQTRIRVFNRTGRLLYDSGPPQNVNVNLGVAKQLFVQTREDMPKDMVFMSIGDSQSVPAPPFLPSTVPAPRIERPESGNVIVFRSIQAGGSAYGFELRLPGIAGDPTPITARSNEKIAAIMQDPKSNEVVGTLQLSEGPAYGSAVLTSVARGWALASTIAVLLAAAMGWYISRRISAPVLALTDVTARMAQGDLSTRADINSRDEFGQLGLSFNEMADQVESTVTTLRRFVSDAAHELHTPLTALRTNLDLALDEREAADRTAFIARAQTMVQRLEELNTNLLDLSKLEANGHAIRESRVDLAELLESRSEMYASQAEQAELDLKMDLPSAPVFVHGNASQITRAIDNLVDNACKFTPPDGTVHITLSEQGGQAIFSVTDTGIGIPAEELPQIFNRFHRGRNTTPYPGSGLGLAIVRAIVTAHAGNVEVQSAGEGQGSQFSIKLSVVDGLSS